MRKSRRFASSALVMAAIFSSGAGFAAAAASTAREQGSSNELGNRPERLEWLQDAGFGMFIHYSHDSAAFENPPYAETGKATESGNGKILLEGNLKALGGAAEVQVGFEYQVYGGFAEAMYNTKWERARMPVPIRSPGPFQLEIDGLQPGKTYQYRAFVQNPKITMRGDHRRVTVK